MSLHRALQTYLTAAAGEHHRYRSWEHCFGYFQRIGPDHLVASRDDAALQLGFYLASWGMYRGSSFLLQHAYTVHRGVVDVLCEPDFRPLWRGDFGASATDSELAPLVLKLVDDIRSAYRPFAPQTDSAQPTDTLVTKIILGTLGTLPACDRYFIDGFKGTGHKYSYLNRSFVERLVDFCQSNLAVLREEQAQTEIDGGTRYPLMKLIDMYFWQCGFERA